MFENRGSMFSGRIMEETFQAGGKRAMPGGRRACFGGEYQLVMRYTGEFEGDVDEYTLAILNLDHIQFSGTVSSGGSRRSTARGTFTRL